MDPLSALRDFTIRGELHKIHQVGDELRFGSDYVFPAAAETAYRSKHGTPYTLETLHYFISNHALKHIDYMQSARLHRVPAVTLPDRKPLLDYLTGKVSATDAVDLLPAVEEYRPDEPALDPLSPARPRVPDLNANVTAMIMSLERPLKDRESLLQCKNRNFLEILEASIKREDEKHRLESQQRKDGLVAKSRIMGTDDHQRGLVPGGGDDAAYKGTPRPKMSFPATKIGDGVPIILVPSASQTLITIYNVKEFLEDGVFVPSDAKAKEAAVKPDRVTVQKKLSRDRLVTAYEVRDKTSGLKKEDWDRVVAVFVLGKEWQFKDWPFKDHVEIFNKIIGFYVRFEDDSVESAKIVKQWNVKIISISKNKRHQDRAAALEVWGRLEEFVRSRSHT